MIYEGQCAELCGRNHADMLASVIGLPYDDWMAWYDQKARGAPSRRRTTAAAEREQIDASEEGE